MRVTFGAGFLLLGCFGLLPAIAVLVFSFTNVRGLPGVPINWVGFSNYVQLFGPGQLPELESSLGHTFEFAVASTLLELIFALGIALLLNQRLRGRNIFRAIVFMPVILGVTIIGLVWTLIFNPAGGPANGVLSLFGHTSAFFGDPNLALPLVIFVQVWATVGVLVVIFLAGLQVIPEELYEAADMDGASAWQRFWKVTYPMLAPSMTVNVLLGIVWGLQSYQLIYVLTGPTNPATQVLSLQIFSEAFGGVANLLPSQTQGFAAATSMVQFLIVTVFAMTALVYLRRRENRL
jgi:ABC-type sugar transport system permease subunit